MMPRAWSRRRRAQPRCAACPRAFGALGVVAVVRDVDPRQVVCDDVTDAARVPRHLRERAHHQDQPPAPVVPIERGDHRPIGARRVAIELIDPRCTLGVVPRDLCLPCLDRWLVLVVVGVGCLGPGLAQRCLAVEAHLLHVPKSIARPL